MDAVRSTILFRREVNIKGANYDLRSAITLIQTNRAETVNEIIDPQKINQQQFR